MKASWPPVSGAPLPASVDRDSTLDIDEADRYERGLLLGRGGMGEVALCWDQRLEREVAYKTLQPARSERRFVDEARITASLEHPAIVPIHDIGHDHVGQPYYTMRAVRGRTLTQATQETDEPLRLVRHVLDVCHALAYAHDRGVLHRDLTPNNVLVGAFGETQIIDWGLAVQIASPEAQGNVGTEGFKSPEQAAGEPVGPASDIYSLGAVLQAVAGDHAPPALQAIFRRAMQQSPERRYPTALAMAQDLEAWFEGRRVDAHDYSAWELLHRLIRLWRAPLMVAVVLLSVLAIISLRLSAETRVERDRALVAEAEAKGAYAEAETARLTAEAALAKALVGQARVAEAAGAQAQAETLAVAALQLGENPEARGVLARYFGQGTRRVATTPLDCANVVLAPAIQRLACLGRNHLTIYDLDGVQLAHATVPGRTVVFKDAQTVYFNDANRGVYTWDLSEEPRRLATAGQIHMALLHDDRIVMSGSSRHIAIDPQSGGITKLPLCDRGTTTMARHHSTSMVLGCSEGPLVLNHKGQQALVYGIPEGRLTTLTWSNDGQTLFAGTSHGEVLVIDPDRRRVVHRFQASGQSIHTLRPHQGRLAVLAAQETSVWRWATGSRLAMLPFPATDAQWQGTQLVVGHPRGIDTWQVDDTPAERLMVGSEGLADLDVSDDGSLVATAHGDGSVRVYENGQLQTTLEVLPGVAKGVAFGPDHQTLAVASAGHLGAVVVDWHTDQRQVLGDHLTRGVHWVGNELMAIPYGPPPEWWQTPGYQALAPRFDQEVFALQENGGDAFVLAREGGLWRLTAPPVQVDTIPHIRSFAVFEDKLVQTDGDTLFWWNGGQTELTEPVTAMQGSADQQWLAVGHLDGSVALFATEDQRRVAVLRGHDAQVSDLHFHGDVLYSASWDTTARGWSLAGLGKNPQDLGYQVEERWGLDWQDLLE